MCSIVQYIFCFILCLVTLNHAKPLLFETEYGIFQYSQYGWSELNIPNSLRCRLYRCYPHKKATEDFFLAPQIEDPNEKRPTPEDLFLAPLIVPRPLEKEPSKSEFPRNMFI
ncbi:uncharacterized protein LOC123681025 isoform X1 [Harmonia axyridis]|uniref:uncharacterized protein LOC123681025 isoform X1 n=1 Tax=Harmonia axyridis TaxID=115357 RepID=UPI001E2763DF|nr:uncharacterized protein LOC123681025 isoform X1 [Harmonia axyridis]